VYEENPQMQFLKVLVAWSKFGSSYFCDYKHHDSKRTKADFTQKRFRFNHLQYWSHWQVDMV